MAQIEKLLLLSTGHLTEKTTRNALAAPTDSWPCSGGPIPYGWFVYAHDENVGDQIPADLWRCMVFARGLGCEYVKFDCDVEPIPELPWEEF